MRDYVLLYVNGEPHRLYGGDAFLPVTDFLRTRLRLTGTKTACGEGACGSCTILLGRPVAETGEPPRLDYRTVNACLMSVFQADGAHIVTVEGLGGSALSPVQKVVAAGNGAQCGFCTPGVIVSLTHLYTRQPDPDDATVRRALAGNLCRCTGYLPILMAAHQIECAAARSALEHFAETEIAQALAEAARTDLSVRSPSGNLLLRPATLESALRWYAEYPSAIPVAGGTDLGLGAEVAAPLLSIAALPELRTIRRHGDTLHIGATATWEELANASAEAFPELARLLERLGSPQLRAMGTLGGSIATAVFNADILPLLLVQQATVLLASATGSRSVPIEAFLDGAHQPGELIVGLQLPLPAPGEILRLYKVARRQAFDRAIFSAAIAVRLVGRTIQEARVACSGAGPRAVRLGECERVLTGAPFTEATMRAAGQAAAAEITPQDDAYAGAEYRRQLAANLPLRFFHEVREGETTP